jgi:hypothetical protein
MILKFVRKKYITMANAFYIWEQKVNKLLPLLQFGFDVRKSFGIILLHAFFLSRKIRG